MRAATNADQIFEDCRIPAANRLGDEGRGMRLFLETIDHGRIGIAAQALGIARAALERAVEYAKQRQQFGAPIASYQAIGWRLADIFTELEAARPYLWPIAHDIRPAAQSLGIRYCTDCHATDGPFFFGDVTVDSPVVAARGAKKMVEFLNVRPFYTKAFAFSFVFRPWMKIIALGSCAVIAVVLLLYVLKALACVVKVLAGRD